MPTKKRKKFNARFPPSRIKKIMQSDEDVGKVAAAVPVLISRALELFVETLMKNVGRVVENRGARTITPSHLKKCIHAEPRFDFLKDLTSSVPDLQGDLDEGGVSSGSAPATPTINPEGPPSFPVPTSSTPSLQARLLQRQNSTPMNRPRGRPRKRPADSDDSKPSGLPRQHRPKGRGRGRPKKAKIAIQPDSEEEEDSDLDEIDDDDEDNEGLAIDAENEDDVADSKSSAEPSSSNSNMVTPAQAGEATPTLIPPRLPDGGANEEKDGGKDRISVTTTATAAAAAATAAPLFHLSVDPSVTNGFKFSTAATAAVTSTTTTSQQEIVGAFGEVDEDYDT